VIRGCARGVGSGAAGVVLRHQPAFKIRMPGMEAPWREEVQRYVSRGAGEVRRRGGLQHSAKRRVQPRLPRAAEGTRYAC